MKETLLVLWKEKPSDFEDLFPLDALRRAACQLNRNERLLVVFDQFEDFFLLRPKTDLREDKNSDRAEIKIAPLRDFFMTSLPARPKA